ncbi:ABC transporter ATP-binding protein/permease, partial [Streptomyces shenzhenensis]
MSGTAVLLDALAAERTEDPVPARLRAWAAAGRPGLRRAGVLRGAAQLGTVLWAYGLSWGAERGLSALRGELPAAAVVPPALLTAAGVALRAG